MGIEAQTLVSRLRTRLSATTDDALHTEDALLGDVNDGLAAFAEERDWPWLEATDTITLTAGTNSYDFPDGLVRIHALSIDNAEPLQEVQYEDYLRYARMSDGDPQVYVRVGANLLLAPAPATAGTADIYYQIEEAVLEDDTDETLTPARYSSVLVTYAALYSAVRVRDAVLTASLYQLQQQEIKRIYDGLNLSSRGPKIITRTDTRA